MKIIKSLIISLLIIQTGVSNSESINLFEEEIVESTYSLYVWKVLGYRYKSQLWTKGIKDYGNIGQNRKLANNKTENIRAVCLGEEEGNYVFLTLRSFLDPAYPNFFLQGVTKQPLNKVGNPFENWEINNKNYIRYGGLTLTAYKHLGGGDEIIINKATCVTQCDKDSPEYHGILEKIEYIIPSETIEGEKVQIPHKKISARKHFYMQKMKLTRVQYSTKHDVALIYVATNNLPNKVKTLEINNPTLACQILLENNVELLGFDFVFIGKETMELIGNYNPVENEKYCGINKLINAVGLVLGPDTLYMIKVVDRNLDKYIPETLGKSNSKGEALGTFAENGFDTTIKILNEKKIIEKIKKKFIYEISNRLN